MDGGNSYGQRQTMVADRAGDFMATHASDSQDTRLALLEQAIGHISDTLLRFEKRFDKIDDRFDRIDSKFEKFETKYDVKVTDLDNKIDVKSDEINTKIDSSLRWIMGTLATVTFSAISIIAHLLHLF